MPTVIKDFYGANGGGDLNNSLSIKIWHILWPSGIRSSDMAMISVNNASHSNMSSFISSGGKICGGERVLET